MARSMKAGWGVMVVISLCVRSTISNKNSCNLSRNRNGKKYKGWLGDSDHPLVMVKGFLRDILSLWWMDDLGRSTKKNGLQVGGLSKS